MKSKEINCIEMGFLLAQGRFVVEFSEEKKDVLKMFFVF